MRFGGLILSGGRPSPPKRARGPLSLEQQRLRAGVDDAQAAVQEVEVGCGVDLAVEQPQHVEVLAVVARVRQQHADGELFLVAVAGAGLQVDEAHRAASSVWWMVSSAAALATAAYGSGAMANSR